MIHKKLPEVEVALSIKSKKDREEAFAVFKRKGILEVNVAEAGKAKPKYEREREAQKYTEISYCSRCLVFVSKRFWHNHVKSCQKHSCQKVLPVPVGLLGLPEEARLSEEFKKNILSHFRTDKIGEICLRDITILKIGSVFYDKEKRKLDKVMEARSSVRNAMRQLAHLYNLFSEHKNLPIQSNDSSKMFLRSNFFALRESIDIFTKKADSGIKAGLKQNLFYLIKRAAKVLKALYLSEANDSDASETDKFVSVLEMWEDFIFGDATYQLNKNKNVKSRKPSELPVEEDVIAFRNFVITKMADIAKDSYHWFDSECFVELRDCACARLTLLNARRGMELQLLSLILFNKFYNNIRRSAQVFIFNVNRIVHFHNLLQQLILYF